MAEIGIAFMLILATGFIAIEIKGLIDSKKREDEERRKCKMISDKRALEIIEHEIKSRESEKEILEDMNQYSTYNDERIEALKLAKERLQHQVNEEDTIKLVCPRCKNEWIKPIGEFCSSCGSEMTVEEYNERINKQVQETSEERVKRQMKEYLEPYVRSNNE